MKKGEEKDRIEKVKRREEVPKRVCREVWRRDCTVCAEAFSRGGGAGGGGREDDESRDI